MAEGATVTGFDPIAKQHEAAVAQRAARVTCRGCGSPLAPAEGVTSFACPHCKFAMQRVQLMAPG